MSLLGTSLNTTVALFAFAANSVACRLALAESTIDAASFSTIRLVSGALTLLSLSAVSSGERDALRGGDWASATALFLYAVPFSFAYVTLSAGTGALILFGTVQVTMLAAALRAGERPHVMEWVGWGAALAGLVYLVGPGVEAPTPVGSVLMATAGIAWGVYSLWGRGSRMPVTTTTGNFARTVPMAAVLSVVTLNGVHLSAQGVFLACLSGALASGVGYVVWYAALRGLTATRAATVQLAVPVIAAAGGVLFLAEPITPRLLISATLILGGVALSVAYRSGHPRAAVLR